MRAFIFWWGGWDPSVSEGILIDQSQSSVCPFVAIKWVVVLWSSYANYIINLEFTYNIK